MVETNADESMRTEVGQLDRDVINSLRDLLNTFRILQDYLNDQVVQDLSVLTSPVFKLVNAMSATDLIDLLEQSLQDPNLDKALLNPPKVGALSLLRALGNKEAQRGMGIMIELLKAIGRASEKQ